jgi:putative ABC transport system permease protein
MGIPLLAGRVFTDGDHAGSPGVAIVNESLARQLFPDKSPLGQALPSEESDAPAVRVVGVVRDTSQASYDQPAKGEIYRPIRQFIFAAFMSTIVVRTPGDPLAIAAAVQKEVWAVDADQPVIKVETMNEVVARSIWRPRFSAWIFSALGTLALLLTAVGVYGVVAYTTSLRAHEIGIRVALGATPGHVVAVICRGAMLPISAGVCVGLICAVLLSHLLASLLFEIGATDPVTYIGAGALLLAMGAAAVVRPAWRAAAGDPVRALRMD